MKLYYVINARLPNKKAYGIQIAKMCEAFIEAGVDLTLVIPRTRAARSSSMRDFYKLRVDIPTVTLPTFDWYDRGRFGYFTCASIFSKMLFFFFLYQRLRGRRGMYYSIPDTLSFSAALCAGVPSILEMHSVPSDRLFRWILPYARAIITTNPEIRRSIEGIVPSRDVLVEANGVDSEIYGRVSQEEARRQLGLPRDKKIALYVGRFYAWKDLGILVEAAALAPEVDWYVVGGSTDEFKSVTEAVSLPRNLYVTGECKSSEVPTWLAAADTLLVLGTKGNQESYRYTTPMKVYEYMLGGRPVVASGTPALKSFISPEEAMFYLSDDAQSLAQTVLSSIEEGEGTRVMVERARQSAEEHTWAKRAGRIISFIRESLEKRA